MTKKNTAIPENPNQLSDLELLQKTKELVTEERRLNVKVLHYLREVETRRLYAARGFSSLFEFCTGYLNYSESAAQRRIASMRLLKEVPSAEKKLEEGKLSLSTLALAQTFFNQEAKSENKYTPEAKLEILQILEGKSTRECETELVKRATEPAALRPDRIKPVTPHMSEIRFMAPESLVQDLKKLKALLAHRNPQMTMAELVGELSEIALKKLDPSRKSAPKALNQGQAKPDLTPEPSEPPLPAPAVKPNVVRESRNIGARLRRFVLQRDGYQCTYRDPLTGKRCNSYFALEIDHIIPFAQGGPSTAENLRTLCRSHNTWHAIETYGKAKMSPFFRF